ncbi:putative YigZ family protein [Salsuginibacillus halophilus]|uniref:Putative YigZ family protein n=1 Tax=Salsuginibacillus halophilus TaxID=517424 RepID=A0A2P8HQR9_9BACI|nr:YigZ family protein [Salsuginibacillus halophilus]PSL48559.1 putative YigZ family protein [Salsuginibacillus halophilus]
MLTSYYTVKTYGETEIVIQKSRFITYVTRAETEAEAQSFIEQIKKQHWNATHNCSAYLIGEQDDIQKANDDGEPSGTAGLPMLEVLKKRGLKDTVVVVTRYFGGIKLGAGGLIRAYGNAVSEGLNETGVVERRLMDVYTVAVDYTLLGKVENELRNSTYDLHSIDYAEAVNVHVYVPKEAGEGERFETWLTNLTNGQAAFSTGEPVYLETDVTHTEGRV